MQTSPMVFIQRAHTRQRVHCRAIQMLHELFLLFMLLQNTKAPFYLLQLVRKSNDFHSTDLIWIYERIKQSFYSFSISMRHHKPQPAKEQSAFSPLLFSSPETAQNNLITQCGHKRPLPDRAPHNPTTYWKSTNTISIHNKGTGIMILKYVDNT